MCFQLSFILSKNSCFGCISISVVQFVRDIQVFPHISTETVILLHDDSADKSLTGIAHHLHKCGTVHHIFARLAVIAIDTIIAFSHKSDTLLLLCGNGQRIVALILVTNESTDVDRRDTVICFRYRHTACRRQAECQEVCGGASTLSYAKVLRQQAGNKGSHHPYAPLSRHAVWHTCPK